jgi:hypothetical protein
LPVVPSQKRSLVLLLLFVVGVVAGGGVIWFSQRQFRYQLQTQQWPVVMGTILHCEQKHKVTGGGKWSGAHGIHYAAVTYTYQVHDKVYVSGQVSLWNPAWSGDDAYVRAFVLNHPEGSPVEVHYDPNFPDQAVLIPGASRADHRFLTGCGGTFIMFGLVGLLLDRVPRRV